MLKRFVSVLVFLVLVPEISRGEEGAFRFPNTRLGQTLKTFLRVVERGDERAFEAFIEQYMDAEFRNSAPMEEHIDQFRAIHEALGAVEIMKFEMPGPNTAELVVLTVETGESYRIRMSLHTEHPQRIIDLGVSAARKEMEPIELNPAYADYRDPNETIEGELGRAMHEFVMKHAENGFSGTVLAVKDGRRILHRGYGFADRRRGIPNTTETVFDVASFAKSFTMAAILKLEDEGKLTTDDPITRFFDDVPDDKRAITVHHLMSMQSGLHEYHDESGDFEEMDRSEAVRRIMAQGLRFEPGTDRGYSNSGFTLLAVIIEKVSGLAYRDYVRIRFFEPAGLKQTGFYRDPRWRDDRVARGYGDNTFGEENSPLHWPEITWACIGNGCLCSTAGDLGRWLDALDAHEVLSEKSVEKLYSIYQKPTRTDWAGPVLGTAEANDFGFTAASYQFPESNAYLIVTANEARAPAPRLAGRLARVMFGREPVEDD